MSGDVLAVDELAVNDRILGGGVGRVVRNSFEVAKKSAFLDFSEPDLDGGFGGGRGSDVSENGDPKKALVLLPLGG